VPNANEEDSKLSGDGLLRDVGVVVEDDMAFDEFHEAIEDIR
jgi:hypothetical protein